jgi:fused signal recognition particle receptor
MKHDLFPDETTPSNNNQNKNSLSVNDDSLDWAKEAYLQLKKKQNEEKQIREKEIQEKEIFNQENIDNTIKNNIKDDFKSNILDKKNLQVTQDVKEEELHLGDFDDTFTWSAEVLAAQGKKVDEFSLDEIDWLSRLKQGLEKTRKGFVTDLLDKLGDDPLTPEVLDDLETLLLRADAGVSATDQILDSLRSKLNEEVVDASEGLRFLKEQLVNVLEKPIKDSGVDLLSPKKGVLNIWMLVGVNGVGKTTTLGKLASVARRSGFSAMIAAADTFRAAAVQQVKVWGERTGVEVIANESKNADPASIVFDAIGASKSKNIDLLLVDTAGRLQTKNNLMEELKKIRKIIDKLAPNANVESLLVLDSSQGQNGLKQALAFADSAELTGVILTKLDGSSRGGVAMAVASEAKLPVRFIGAGEKLRDLRPFNSFEFIEALLTNR